MALRKLRKYWYAYFRDEFGKLHTVSTRQTEQAQARAFDLAMRKEINSRRSKLKLLRLASPELLETARRAEEEGGRPQGDELLHRRGTLPLQALFPIAEKHRTLSETHRKAWNHFVKHIGVKFADQVSQKMALAYLDEHYGKRKAKTWNNNKSMLNTVFRLTLVESGLSASPFAAILNRIVNDTTSHRNLTEEEIARVLAAGDPLAALMTMLARWTGQRLETCARMTFGEFDFERKVYLAKPGKTARFGKWVCVPLFPPLEKFLREHEKDFQDPSAPMVEQLPRWVNGHKFSERYIALLRRVGIESNEQGTASFHSLRGSFITWAIDAGISPDVRRSITGHASLTMEDVYAFALESVSRAAKGVSM